MQTPHRQHLGRLGERLAAAHFARLGFSVLAQNHHTRFGELDLVLSDGRTLVFCEVKAKTGTGFGDPLEMVTPEKVRRVRRAAEVWLAAHDECSGLEVRFDVVVERGGRLEHVADAF